MNKCIVHRLGLVSYRQAWNWQQQLVKERIRSGVSPAPLDVCLMLQHPAVYTLGRGASWDNVKFDPSKESGFELIKVDRGGEVTHHAPGQLVVYPILNLTRDPFKKDLHWYLRQVEQVVIDTLQAFDIAGERVDGLTGVWVPDNRYPFPKSKIAAVGTHASKWITMHGFALNVTTDLSGFNRIVPCGLHDKAVSSIQEFHPNVSMADVEEVVIKSMEKVFEIEMQQTTNPPYLE
ncbi:octanoyltransferase [Thraustotheca clavata]|uniref:lipoyl(octanoyl) transferase n=1 Tax=Thraustotheca clavata TaxID=74557 RepID=A0A1V9YZH0_9STRA|nr:octanoyltransferase [Thraustotheca clavata]